MWKVVYIASTSQLAEDLKSALVNEGFLVNIKAMGNSAKGGLYEILVPASEVEEANEIINNVLSN